MDKRKTYVYYLEIESKSDDPKDLEKSLFLILGSLKDALETVYEKEIVRVDIKLINYPLDRK